MLDQNLHLKVGGVLPWKSQAGNTLRVEVDEEIPPLPLDAEGAAQRGKTVRMCTQGRLMRTAERGGLGRRKGSFQGKVEKTGKFRGNEVGLRNGFLQAAFILPVRQGTSSSLKRHQLWGWDARGLKPSAGRTVAVRNVSAEHTSNKQCAERRRGLSCGDKM